MANFQIFEKDNKHKSDYSVYVLGEKEDLLQCQSFINDLLLKKSNSSIFYQFDKVDDDLYQDALKAFNLAVVLVSSDFLNDNDLLKEKALLEENGVPLLPLQVEEEIDINTYNQIFGEYHLINIEDEDKINAFIDEVLVDSETINKVKQAFDAYIFISYRKKDRKHALDLINLIQNNPKYLNIGVWFDDYLTPGQNFNDEIYDYLEKAALFSMVVTPNLINEQNYVQSIEYPEAVKHHKNVIAFEYEKTDEKELEKLFPHIPQLQIPKQEEIDSLLNKTLLNLSKSQEKDAEHLYFLALAYLYGIVALKNPERAVSLLEKSTDLGFPLASKKLAEIYMFGNGVEVDIKKHYEYAKKYTAIASQDYLKKGMEEEVYNMYIHSLMRNANKLKQRIAELTNITNSYKKYHDDEMVPIMEFFIKQPEVLSLSPSLIADTLPEIEKAYNAYLEKGGTLDVLNIEETKRTHKEVLSSFIVTLYDQLKDVPNFMEEEEVIEFLKKKEVLDTFSEKKIATVFQNILYYNIQENSENYPLVLELMISYLKDRNYSNQELVTILENALAIQQRETSDGYESLLDKLIECLNNDNLQAFVSLFEMELRNKVFDEMFSNLQTRIYDENYRKQVVDFINKYKGVHIALQTAVERIEDKITAATFIPYLEIYYDIYEIPFAFEQNFKKIEECQAEHIKLEESIIEKYKNSNIDLTQVYAKLGHIYFRKAQFDTKIKGDIASAIQDYKSIISIYTSIEGGYIYFLDALLYSYTKWMELDPGNQQLYDAAKKALDNGVVSNRISKEEKKQFETAINKYRKTLK